MINLLGVLFVSKANTAGRKLYDNLGYKYVRDLDDGMYLKNSYYKKYNI